MTLRKTRCAAVAEAGGEALVATAPITTAWLLVEQPAAWGPRTIQDSGLVPDLVAALDDWKERTGGRVALIRRPDRGADGPRRWFVADSRAGREQIRGATFDSETALAELLTVDDAPGPEAAGPIYLVCTHGRHDACCAIRGRPVAAALAARHPEQTWECTHLGGHRFAANLVLLPHGVYYGQVPPQEALRLVAEYGEGRVDPSLLRGRSCFPPPVQAAQHHARLALDEHRLDELAPLDLGHPGTDRWEVRLAHHDDELTVVVRERMADVGPLSCGDAPGRARTFDLVDIAAPSAARA